MARSAARILLYFSCTIVNRGPEGFSNASGLAGAVFGPGDPARHVPRVGMADMFGFKIITQHDRGIVFRWGRALPGVREAGLTWITPFSERLRKVNMQIIVAGVPAQEAITRDNVTLKVDAVVYYPVVDPVKAIINVQNYAYAVSQVAQTSLRSVIGQSDMDQLLSERDKVNAHLKDVIDAPTEEPWGIRVERVEVKDVSLPESMKRSMSRQAEAERERRARIISADGEYQASKKLAQAAAVMAADPAALQLRRLQTVVEVAAEKNSTLVMPVPVELLRFFDRAAPAAAPSEAPAVPAEDPDAIPPVTVPAPPALAAAGLLPGIADAPLAEIVNAPLPEIPEAPVPELDEGAIPPVPEGAIPPVPEAAPAPEATTPGT